MFTVGVVCEYNPFHCGHEYMLGELRRRGAERIICLMSGNAVQRGELAVLPPFYRAAAAVDCGANAVFELPYPWCMASAEFFASAAVGILLRIGVDAVACGSESADEDVVFAAARRGAARSTALPRNARDYFADVGAELAPNDILAAEYKKALIRYGSDVPLWLVRREGAGYNDVSVAAGAAYPSATAVRSEMLAGGEACGVPLPMARRIREAISAGDCPVRGEAISAALIGFWRFADPASAGKYAECGGGVAGRLHASAMKGATLDEFFCRAATKRYTDARLRRAALFGLTGVLQSDLDAAPTYVRLIAADKAGCEFVAESRRGGGIDIVTKPSRLPACRQAELCANMDSIYTLAMPVPRGAGRFREVSPYIENEKSAAAADAREAPADRAGAPGDT